MGGIMAIERAYKLWQEAGCPEDREQEFWHLAEHELTEKAKVPNLPDATG
jgi:hypothetical protein